MFWTSFSFLQSHGSIGCRVSILWIQIRRNFFWFTRVADSFQKRLFLWRIKYNISNIGPSDLKKSFEFGSNCHLTVIIGLFCPLSSNENLLQLQNSLKLHNRYSHTLHKLDQNPRIYRKGSRLYFLIQFLETFLAYSLLNQLKLWGTHFSSQYNHCCFPTGSLFCCKRNVHRYYHK